MGISRGRRTGLRCEQSLVRTSHIRDGQGLRRYLWYPRRDGARLHKVRPLKGQRFLVVSESSSQYSVLLRPLQKRAASEGHTFCKKRPSYVMKLWIAVREISCLCTPRHHLGDIFLLRRLTWREGSQKRQQLCLDTSIQLLVSFPQDFHELYAKIATAPALAGLQQSKRTSIEYIDRCIPILCFDIARRDYAKLLMSLVVITFGNSAQQSSASSSTRHGQYCRDKV